MKYWAYLNDDVSQKAYTEAELQQLPGFGPDILVCSEVSAVSAEPDWRPVKELLPHLIRPKAPDFSKFRPKPPVPGAVQSSSAALPVPETLPKGVTAEAVAHQQSAQPSTDGLNNELLTQIKSLTDKIAALEGQIIEQEKERTFSTPIPSSDFNSEETFVSEPQNEQEDDVLEVPFDNDFEVPFDANKSSEEIAKEAEAMLSKPMTTEIEEFNTDDQGTEGIDYGSDMQKMLEDTIRTTLYKPQNDKQNKSTENKKRTFIAEDLISKTTYRFSDKEAPEKLNEKPVEKKTEEEKETTARNISLEEQQTENKGQESSQEELLQEELLQENANEDIVEESNNQEEIIESGNEEKLESLDDLLEGPSSSESVDELLENSEQENSSEDDSAQENGEEENVEESKQEEEQKEAEQEDIKEEVKADAQLASLDAVPTTNDVESKQEETKQEEIKADVQLASLDSVPEKPTEEPLQEEEINEEKEQEIEEQNQKSEEEIKADITTEENNEDAPVKMDQEEEKEESIVSLSDADEEAQDDIEINKVEEEKESEISDNKEEPVVEELSAEELKMDELVNADEQDQYLKTVALDNIDTDAKDITEQLQVNAEPKPEVEPEQEEPEQTEQELSEDIQEENNQEEKQDIQLQELSVEEEPQELKVQEDTLQKENIKDDAEQEEIQQEDVKQDIQLQELSPIGEKEDPESEDEENIEITPDTSKTLEDTPPEDTANLSVTRVTISEDDTTAAVLDEIAQEKGQNSTSETTANKLFEELEKTYKEENKFVGNTVENPSEDDGATKDKSEDAKEAPANEDEFLKTFTTSVEEVFLDQPTAIISDYVPPSSDTGDDQDHAALLGNGIKRAKPSDIKTVPLVPEVMGQEIHSSPYVESATAKLGRRSVLSNLIKWIFIISMISIMIACGLSFLAFMGVVPERVSLIHTVINSYQKTNKEKDATVNEALSPEIVQEATPYEQNYQEEQNQENAIIEKVKNYTFDDGTTLQSRIRYYHQNLSGEIEWTSIPTDEQNVYSIAVKIPQNMDGQGFSYRFNYNVAGNILTPTTSGAKNIIENFSR